MTENKKGDYKSHHEHISSIPHSRAILQILSDGKVHEKQELMRLTNTSERKVRECISTLRNHGIWIQSNSAKSGYRLVDTAEEIEPTIREYRKRAMELFKTATAMAKGYNDNQIEFERI